MPTIAFLLQSLCYHECIPPTSLCYLNRGGSAPPVARSQTMSVTHTSEACGCEEEGGKGKVVGGSGGGGKS